jgi:ABC-2 type transport system permease protein
LLVARSKYLAGFRISLQSQLAYPAEMWLRTIFVFIIMFVFSSLWHTTFEEMGTARLGGLTLSGMLWYLAITESILISRPRESVRMDEEVRTGQLAYQLVRPYNFILFRFAQVWGERLPRFLVTLLVAATMATVFSGGVGVTTAGLLAGLPVLALALALDFLFVLGISLLAFWAEDTSSFLFIYDRFLMILGGMLLPLELFPGALEDLARALPFAAMVYAPARMFVDPDGGQLMATLGQQAVWLAVVALCTGGLFRYAARRLQTNGG